MTLSFQRVDNATKVRKTILITENNLLSEARRLKIPASNCSLRSILSRLCKKYAEKNPQYTYITGF